MAIAFQGGVGKIEISQDKFSSGEGGKSVVISLNNDLVSLDFTEDMFASSMSGTLVVSDRTGWLGELGGLIGNEWITITFDSAEMVTDERGRKETKPYTLQHRFKAYKISSATSEANTLTTYSLNFTTYQYLIDSVKLEKHLRNQHIGPIATEYDEEVNDSPVDEDVGFVNKLFQAGLFQEDIQIDNAPVLDVEATSNWLNFIPSYLDDRKSSDIVDNYYWWNASRSMDANRGNSPDKARPKQIFEILNELAENSVAKENRNASNFLCWNDLRGWHFRSIDSYLRGNVTLDRSYSHSVASVMPPEIGEPTRIIDLEVKKQVDFMDLLNMQALSSEVVYYELNPDNPYAAYYLSLPSGMQGLQKVMDPTGLNSSVGRTVIDEQAVVQGGLTYDYLVDHTKWSKVEQYPILPDKTNLATPYTDPSFLEIPPQYANTGVGNMQWLGSNTAQDVSDPLNETFASYAPANRGTYYNNQWRFLNPQEYFKSQFLNQTTLDGAKFRTVHNDIKMPIIKALREYYEICLQRLFFEHNLIIEAGINTLESGEGKLGRGPDNRYCDYCISREDALTIGYNRIINTYGEFPDFIREGCRYFVGTTPLEAQAGDTGDFVYDDLCIENTILGFSDPTYYWHGSDLNASGNYGAGLANLEELGLENPEFAYNMTVCTGKRRDRRSQQLAVADQPPIDPTTLRIFEWNIVPVLDSEYQGKEYPRCFTDEPTLPYDGLPVDCVSIKEKFLEIPSECALVREHLGPEYVSPAIRGWYGNPIQFHNNMFWNGYWINPLFNLPNKDAFLGFFNAKAYGGGEFNHFQFFEKEMFIKDFYEYDSSGYIPEPGQAAKNENGWETVGRWSTSQRSSPFGSDIFDLAGGDGILEGIPSHIIYFNVEQNFIDDIQTCSTECNLSGVGGQGTDTCRCSFGAGLYNDNGDNGIQVGSSRGVERSVSVNYKKNRMFNFVKTCGIPQLCGQYLQEGDTVTVPYVSKIVETLERIEDGPPGGFDQSEGTPQYGFVVTEYEVSEIDVDWPSRYSNGAPYDYGIIRTAPFRTQDYQQNWIDSNYIEILRQFGTSPLTTASDGVVGTDLGSNTNTDRSPVAALRGTLETQLAGTAYVPNRNLGLYDQSAPIYNAQDWQRFLDCNGTCVGGTSGGDNNIPLESSKALEYAKYCTYAWNRYWSTPEHQLMYRRAQMNLIQSQEIEITLPMDMNLSIGMVVGVDIPMSPSVETSPGQSVRDGNLNASTGRFLVTGVRRTFTGERNGMKVRLNRDSLPFDPNVSYQDDKQE